MARKAAWEDLADGDLGPDAKPRGTRWLRLFTGLILVAGATFVAAYYLPLYRAHQKLGEQYRELGQKSQALGESLSKSQAELKATSEQRDQLQAEHDQRETVKKSDTDQQDRARAALLAKLEKLVKKGSLAVVPSGSSLLVGIDSALLFVPQTLDLAAPGRALLCDVVKTSQAKSFAIRGVLAEGSVAPVALAKSYPSPFAFSALRAAAVAQGLQDTCTVGAAQLSATGYGSQDPHAAQLGTLPGDRVELELTLH